MTRLARLVVMLFAVAVPGCSREPSTEDWLETARAAHRGADRWLAEGDPEGAARELSAAAEAEAPSTTETKDARVVRQDLYYRLASVEISGHRPREAAAAASKGLHLGRTDDVFTANLLVVRGQAMDQLGDPRGASRDYHAALLINEVLLAASLEGSAHPRSPP